MAMLLSEFDFLPIYRADLAGSRTLSFCPYLLPVVVHELLSNLEFTLPIFFF